MEKTSRKKKIAMRAIGYALGSVAIFAIAVTVMPEVILRVSGEISKKSASYANANRENEDWGPVIEKKQ